MKARSLPHDTHPLPAGRGCRRLVRAPSVERCKCRLRRFARGAGIAGGDVASSGYGATSCLQPVDLCVRDLWSLGDGISLFLC